MLRDKKDIRPALLQLGVAIAISFAGFLYARIQRRRADRSRPGLPPRNSRPSDQWNETAACLDRPRAGPKNDPQIAAAAHGSRIILSTTVEKNDETYVQRLYVDPSTVINSPSSGHNGDKAGILLPEFDDLVKELECTGCGSSVSPKKYVETPQSDTDTPRSSLAAEREVFEQEIMHLRNTVRMLTERERCLEVQLLEYYGLKEQETAVMELQNQLKINNMEAQLFCMKIETLDAENRRLEAKTADYVKVMSELEFSRSKIRVLKKKLKSEAEQNREQILLLQKRVSNFQDREVKSTKADAELQSYAEEIKHLQQKVEELKKRNVALQLENSELNRRLDSTQLLANCVLEDPEGEALKREGDHLKREIESLKKEVEQQKADRCTDLEELVYLRWINACLRYELRNYQPPPGKPAARDLSKTLSPKSEKAAKQLILDYAHTEGTMDKAVNYLDFDSDQWSSSQTSYLTDSGDPDEASVNSPRGVKTNHHSKRNRLFGKLRRLVLGKEGGREESRHSSVERTVSLGGPGSYSFNSSHDASSGMTEGDSSAHWTSCRYTTPPGSTSRHSLDIQRLRSFKSEDAKEFQSEDTKEFQMRRRNSDVGIADRSKDMELSQSSESVQKQELANFAKVLKDTRGGAAPKLPRKVHSFSSF
ncbi:hypothetical protein MLD38_004854 [Melastoma candidum]|uniref:Uncharacterized protein n=1 Tax=Melastoma candidum TaxID=119954 RepID=A0ACB9S6J0_9MYRT|nr:hypothetical protein MLD38_004854 [Melastoma candidum]